MYKKILVPVDGSEHSKLALIEAVKVARASSAALLLVHIIDEFLIDPAIDAGYKPLSYNEAVLEALRAGGRRVIEQAEEFVRSQGLEPQSALLETVGRGVAELIIEKAKEWQADLIVMGTHGRRGWRRLLMGSDAELVLRSGTVPVLLVRARS
jgi:nucleotide-binding universal stress UspA family protein